MSEKFPDHTCPRCLGAVPNASERGQYPGAISRTDDKTEICSDCGVLEALEQWGGKENGGLLPQEEWRIWAWVGMTLSAKARKKNG
jgi:hypothetical protein